VRDALKRAAADAANVFGPQETSAFAAVRPFTGADALDAVLPPRRYLLQEGDAGVLPRGKVGLVLAGGGVGKTFLLTHLAVCVVTGRVWLDRFTPNSEDGDVLLVLAEENAEEAKRRLQTIARRLNLNAHEHGTRLSRVHVLALAGHDVTLTKTSDDGTLETTRGHADLLRFLQAHPRPWALVAIDPLSRFAAADAEIDNAAATRFVTAVERLTEAPGEPTVLVAHHTSKSARKAGETAETASRGAVALTDGARWAATVTRRQVIKDAPQLVDFTVSKSNYGPVANAVLVQRPEAHGMLECADVSEIYAYAEAEKEKAAEATAERVEANEIGRKRGRERAKEAPPASGKRKPTAYDPTPDENDA
jgi:RecA-family ATPase